MLNFDRLYDGWSNLPVSATLFVPGGFPMPRISTGVCETLATRAQSALVSNTECP